MDGKAIASQFNDINTSIKWITYSNQTAKMTHQPTTYFCCTLIGYVGGYGGVDLQLKCSAGTLTVWDRDANSAWARSDVLSFAYDSNTGIFTFYCGQYGMALLLIGC